MPKIIGSFSRLKLDKPRLTKEIDKRAHKLNVEAAREAVRALIVQVPVYTGMARGSIKFAKGRSGAAAGHSLYQFLRVAIPIAPIATRKDKNPLAGGRQGRFTLSGKNGKYRFTLSTSVTHYIINEWYEQPPGHASFSAPWHSFQAAEVAYNNYLSLKKFGLVPDIWDYVIKTDVPFGL